MLETDTSLGPDNNTYIMKGNGDCCVCGLDIQENENKTTCETCLNHYHVPCMGLPSAEELTNAQVVWICCYCGNNNLSKRLYDQFGIPIDVNMYEHLTKDNNDNDHAAQPSPITRAQDKRNKSSSSGKKHIPRGKKRLLSPNQSTTKKRKSDECKNSNIIEDNDCQSCTSDIKTTFTRNTFRKRTNYDRTDVTADDSAEIWRTVKTRRTKPLNERGVSRKATNANNDPYSSMDKGKGREKGVTYIGKAMAYLYSRSTRRKQKSHLKQSQNGNNKDLANDSTEKNITTNENDLANDKTGKQSTKENEDNNSNRVFVKSLSTPVKDNEQESQISSDHSYQIGVMATLFSKNNDMSKWTSSNLDTIVTCAKDADIIPGDPRESANNPSGKIIHAFDKCFELEICESHTGPLIQEHTETNVPSGKVPLINALQDALDTQRKSDGCLVEFNEHTFVIMPHTTGYYIFDTHAQKEIGGRHMLMHTNTWTGAYAFCLQLAHITNLPNSVAYRLIQVKVHDPQQNNVSQFPKDTNKDDDSETVQRNTLASTSNLIEEEGIANIAPQCPKQLSTVTSNTHENPPIGDSTKIKIPTESIDEQHVFADDKSNHLQQEEGKGKSETSMPTSIFDEDPDDLIILGEIQKSVLHFSPVNEMKKKDYCTKLNIQQITPNSDNEGQTCQPIEHPCTIKHVTGDGNCFFRAISFCVSGNENNHLLVRKAIVVHLLKNKNRFETRVRDGFANVSDYVTKSKVFQRGTWATEMEIMVLANLIETDIYIYDEQNAKWSIFSGKDVQLGVVTSDKGIYLRHTQRIHYDVVLSVQSFHCDNSNEQYIGTEKESTHANDAPQYQIRNAQMIVII